MKKIFRVTVIVVCLLALLFALCGCKSSAEVDNTEVSSSGLLSEKEPDPTTQPETPPTTDIEEIYSPYGMYGYESASDLVINQDGTIDGDITYSAGATDKLPGSGIAPIDIMKRDDGSVYYTLIYEQSKTSEFSNLYTVGYIVYPAGVQLDGSYSDYEWFHDYEDTTRILYFTGSIGASTVICYCPADSKTDDDLPDTDDEVLAAMQKGDFSYFAGTYEPAGVYHDYYGGGEELPDLILHDDGIATGGLNLGSFAETAPIKIEKNEDGSYRCQITYTDENHQEYYIIYPSGVIGPNPYVYNDPTLTNNVYIQYIQEGGGVVDIIYINYE